MTRAKMIAVRYGGQLWCSGPFLQAEMWKKLEEGALRDGGYVYNSTYSENYVRTRRIAQANGHESKNEEVILDN